MLYQHYERYQYCPINITPRSLSELLITKYKERLEGDVGKITLTQSKKIIRKLSELISFVEIFVFLQSVNVFMTFIVNHSHECVPFRIFGLLF